MFDKSLPKFLTGGGESGELIRSINWSKTELGNPEKWPLSLKTSIKILLDCKLPMHISWGGNLIQFYNDAYRPILGHKHPKAMGISASETWNEIWPTIGPMFEDVLRGNSIGFDDFKLTIERYGYPEDCYFNFSYSPLPNDLGDAAGVLITYAETTGRVLSEQKIKEESEKLNSVLMQAPVGIALTEGPDHVFALTNSTYLSMLFGKDRNLLGQRVIDAVPEAKDQGYIDLLDQVFLTGESFTGREAPLSLRQLDGSDKNFFVTFIYQPIRNAEGEVSGILGVVYDVTEQVETRHKIEESQVQFSTLANSIPQLAWMAQADGYIYWYNNNWFDYTGSTLEQMEGWGWQSVHDPKILPKVMENWPKSIQTGEPFEMEFPLKGRDNKFRWFLTRVVPVKNAEGVVTGWIGSNTDIDAQRSTINALETEKALREQFVSTLTHDLRTPLSAVKISAQLLSRSSNAPEKLTSLSGRIMDNVDRANQMIENLLDANRIKAGEALELDMQEMRLVSVVTDSLSD
nr:PAS domain-containing protein [Bdellovibrionales bacterium]